MPTASERANADIVALLKARNPLLVISTREEKRVEHALIDAAPLHRAEPVFWDCISGLTNASGEPIDAGLTDTLAILGHIQTTDARRLYILRDFHRHWDAPQEARFLRNLCRSLIKAPLSEARAIVVITPDPTLPPQIAAHAITVDYPLPERQEIGAILDTACAARPELADALVNGARERAIDAAIGLTSQEIESTYARSIVTTRQIDADLVAAEKKRVIARERVLTWIDPDPRGLDSVGGLELYKGWIVQRRLGFSAKAREFGLHAPKGVLTVGVPGCGKSAMAKAIASAWKMPLLAMNMGSLKGGIVGESERNFAAAIRVAETVAPAILWVDEIEKGFAGAKGGGNDSGVSAHQLQSFLTWMQEHTAPVFVVATANDISGLPPELLRKGRFDELFFVDLPTRIERAAILSATLQAYGRTPALIACEQVARATDGFSGAEIAALVPDALFSAFADNGREITTEDLLTAAGNVTPLSKTAGEKIAALRDWAKGRARPASLADRPADNAGSRQLDLDD